MGVSASKGKVSPEAKKVIVVYKPPENDYQLVFEAIKDLEYTLLAHFDSSGDHLHQMISTTKYPLPMDLIVDMRSLATIRNNMAHEYSCDQLPDRQAFIDKYRRCVTRLNEQIERQKEEEDKFYNEVVQRHRQLHPRPAIKMEEDKTQNSLEKPLFSCVTCF